MSTGALAANTAWFVASFPAWRRFRSALRHPERAQRQILARHLRLGCGTAFGEQHGLDRIASIEAFQDRVPLMTADDLSRWAGRITGGERNVLTRDPVTRFVPSSGSTSAVKLVPYTRGLHRELAAAVGAWTAELFRVRPALLSGSAYWSVTPAAGADRPFVGQPARPASAPIGFDDDAEYLGGVRGALARRVLAVPSDVRWHTDLAAFREDTLVHLLRAADLRLASVWHPSFLTGLLDTLTDRWEPLMALVAAKDRRRARSLEGADPRDLRSVWPGLGLVSCWADGASAAPAETLAARLAGIELQRKGLLATEGVVSIPFAGRHPVAVTSHFFEFLDDQGRPHLVHALERGAEYDVVLTTAGGLWRYRLGDRVRVDGHVRATPSLRFVGRSDRVSDLVGEKLSDGFVSGVLDRLFAGAPRPAFEMLAPDARPGEIPRYALFAELDARLPGDLPGRLDRELRRNPHYAWARDLGQLAPATVVAVPPGSHDVYVAHRHRAGQRLGDIKPACLESSGDWRDVFAARTR